MSQPTFGFIGFLFRLIYRLTVQLVVELLKLGIVALTLLVTLLVFVAVFILGVLWCYEAYDGNIFIAVGAGLGLLSIQFLLLMLIQYVVKDVLHLTDLSLWTLTIITVGALLKDNNNKPASANTNTGTKSKTTPTSSTQTSATANGSATTASSPEMKLQSTDKVSSLLFTTNIHT